jgi:hypothetical protein
MSPGGKQMRNIQSFFLNQVNSKLFFAHRNESGTFLQAKS